MFRKLFARGDGETQKSPRDIVYDFAEILGQLNLPVLDERLLPHPKEQIYEAFHVYMAQVESMARYSSESRQELQQLRIVYMHIGDFQRIDPEDMQLVAEINTGRRFAKFRSREGLLEGCKNQDEEEDLRIFTEITGKYTARGASEQDLGPRP